ncbi:MAG: hypothetical protein WC969_02060 [Elusimicrobiota bacterium]|jgi:hypothetical protein
MVVLLKMTASNERSWRLVDLSQELGLSVSEVSMALERCKRSRLLDSSRKKINRAALLEFVVHGLKYVYPAEPGSLSRGVPTAHSAPPLSRGIVSNENDQYVWPSGEGSMRGQAIEPLYPSVPHAAMRDPALHELLALVDALRVGRARERQIAAEELERRLHAA